MKKFLLFSMMALVAMCGLNSCSEDCNHDYIEVDYSKKLAGTWTCVEPENAYAEALVINADGSVTSTGVFDGGYWEKKGTYQIKDNKMTLSFEDGDNIETRFEMVEGVAFSLVDDELDVRYDYYYCKNDLADEIIGMWVSTDAPTANGDVMTVQTYKENGKVTYTGFGSYVGEFVVNDETNYKVVGDLLFYELPQDMLPEGVYPYIIKRLTYAPNGNAYGDLMVQKSKKYNDDKEVEVVSSMLRIKQHLNLAGKAYDYNNTYVSNVKGLDEDMTMMGYTFNIGKMEGKNLDKMLKTLLFAVEFPNANTIKYQYHYNGQTLVFEAPIVVDGNKVTIKMSELSTYYRDVDMYMFQDQGDCQLHMYMPTYAFINYFANMDLAALAFAGEIDVTDEVAVEAIFDRMDERVESINVSFIFKAAK